MYNFDWVFPTPKEHTPWKNTCQYIILHHTATVEWTTQWVLDWLNKRDDFASCHFLVDDLWRAYKMGQPTDILWHAGVSAWWNLKDMNPYSIWIEIIWPGRNWWFTDLCFAKVCDLVKYLRNALNIPLENVIKHSDITQLNWNSEKKILRDWVSAVRKWDLAPSFRHNRWYATYMDFRAKCL